MNNVNISSLHNTIVYIDTKEHFENAVLRLLSLNNDTFLQWLNFSEEFNKNNLLSSLSFGFNKLKPIKSKCKTNIFCDVIAENMDYGIVKENNIGHLVKLNNGNFLKEIHPPSYEEEYFEGDKYISGGYGQYLQQSSWRLEKAERQVKEIQYITKKYNCNVLDVGSGYGYFRKALDDSNYNHSGIEISSFAANMCKKMYNFDTYIGTPSDFKNELYNKFDIVTLWDVIEHIADYEQFLFDISCMLKSGGFLIIKTPNIDCPEVNVFGSHYHSFKREHLTYFTNDGLINCSSKFGFESFYSSSISHLLKGFVGEKQTKIWADNLNGSDLIVYLRKK